MNDDILTKLEHLETMLSVLVERQTVKDWYTTIEVAGLLGRAEYTVREWCRLRRIHSERRRSGRGAHTSYAISHPELLRFQREGLLPLQHKA